MTIKKEKIGNITWNVFHYLTYQTENVKSLKHEKLPGRMGHYYVSKQE